MVDLNDCAGSLAPGEGDDRVGVGVMQHSASNGAALGAWLDDDAVEISAKDVVTAITAVVAVSHRDIVGPSRAELGTTVASHGRSSLDGQGGQSRKCRA